MGAWENGPFDNDSALDGIEDIREGSLSDWLDDVYSEYLEEKYLDSDVGSAVVAMSALIVGFRYEGHEEEQKREWDRYVSFLSRKEVKRLKKLLKIVLTSRKRSELYELWADDPVAFEEWERIGKNIYKQLR